MPVSYTHLDVYKRQNIHCLRERIVLRTVNLPYAKSDVCNGNRYHPARNSSWRRFSPQRLGRILYPVSYTHLGRPTWICTILQENGLCIPQLTQAQRTSHQNTNEHQCLLDAVDSLGETDKICLSVIYYSHMPLAESAEMLDMSLSSVKMRKKRALKKLKQKMENSM